MSIDKETEICFPAFYVRVFSDVSGNKICMKKGKFRQSRGNKSLAMVMLRISFWKSIWYPVAYIFPTSLVLCWIPFSVPKVLTWVQCPQLWCGMAEGLGYGSAIHHSCTEPGEATWKSRVMVSKTCWSRGSILAMGRTGERCKVLWTDSCN